MRKPKSNPGTVFLVEDDENTVFLLRSFLEGAKFQVLVARDGQAAKEFIEANLPPDIVLLDIILPYVDGFELIRLIRGDAAWQSTPILMLTVKGNDEDVARAMEAGANGYIQKPFEPNQLMDRIRKHAKAPPLR